MPAYLVSGFSCRAEKLVHVSRIAGPDFAQLRRRETAVSRPSFGWHFALSLTDKE
jgi:hypothetical protein